MHNGRTTPHACLRLWSYFTERSNCYLLCKLDTIKRLELDAQNGFEMEVNGVAGGAAAKVAFQAGETDVIVTDWLWVARQRAQGKDYRFIPYSKAVGSLIVKNDSPIRTLEDLKGSKVGIAGGPLDKSWLILRAYAMQEHGMDLKGDTEQVFGAPPLMMKAALTGETSSVSWSAPPLR
ncbi:MAG: ABC transporter substrate-binding protein, partial [Paracoccaceae bacterium]